FQAEDGIRDFHVTGVQTCALPISLDPDAVPAVIFVTAYDQHALRAFELHAVDYLLKPFDDERFEIALERARSRIERGHLVGLSRSEERRVGTECRSSGKA